jgi:preprotein translocase subunit SecY
MAVFQGFSNIFKVPELRRRVTFTLALLAVYRVACSSRPRAWTGRS